MKFVRLFAVALLALLLPAVRAQHVKASFVAADASVQPGQKITIALRLIHDPHWHTYWTNPGTGLVTAIKWKLPAGWSASEIMFPAPHVLKDRTGTIVGNGFEGDLLLPVTITAPADAKAGETVTLAGEADWLMCEDVCMPGSAKLTLPLAVAADTPKPDAQWGEKIRTVVAGLPRAEAAWQLAATRAGKTITLTVKAAAANGAKPSDLRFFADDNLVAYELPQDIKSDGAGGFVLKMPISPDGPQDAKQLLGVLTSETGWLSGGALRGLRVEIPLATETAATAAPTGAKSATVSGATAVGAAPSSLPVTLAFAFIGGLILNLMPCVFPVIGIKILGFVNQAGSDRSKVVGHGLVFAAGVLLSFWTLAGVLAVLRSGGAQLGWGFQLQSPVFVFGLAVLMLVFAMNMSGVFEFGLSATAIGGELQMKSGLAGSFFTGILATVVATPCSAPFLATALGAALSVSTLESFAIFTAIAIGLSTPYLLLSIFPAAVKILPRPGAWMETFKQLMAFPLYATVGYLVWVLFGQVSDDAQLTLVFALTLIAFAVWVYGRWNQPGASEASARGGLIAGIALGAVGLWLGWPKPVLAAGAPLAAGAVPEVTWDKWSPETVAKLRAEGRTVYVDFTARWCATCQANKKLVFHNDDVLRTFADKKIVTLRADWTNNDPAITAELAKYQRSAVPFNLVWLPGKDEPAILPELLTPSIVLDAVKKG